MKLIMAEKDFRKDSMPEVGVKSRLEIGTRAMEPSQLQIWQSIHERQRSRQGKRDCTRGV